MKIQRGMSVGLPGGKPAMEPIPWDIIAPLEAQAHKNHGQTLARLRERGGLSVCEAVAIIEDRHWRSMSEIDAIERLGEIICTATARI